jgi:hypothetical protein
MLVVWMSYVWNRCTAARHHLFFDDHGRPPVIDGDMGLRKSSTLPV